MLDSQPAASLVAGATAALPRHCLSRFLNRLLALWAPGPRPLLSAARASSPPGSWSLSWRRRCRFRSCSG